MPRRGPPKYHPRPVVGWCQKGNNWGGKLMYWENIAEKNCLTKNGGKPCIHYIDDGRYIEGRKLINVT